MRRLPFGLWQNSWLTILALLACGPLKIESSDCDTNNFELVYSAFGAPIRSNDTYIVKVFTENIADATMETRHPELFNYTFSILCTDYNWVPSFSFNSTSVILKPGTIQDVSIPVSSAVNDCQYLQLTTSFRNSKNKTIVTRPLSSISRQGTGNSYNEQNITTIMIQTDKPIYKPGDTIKFRILVLNQRLFPNNEPNVTVVITDSQSNILKRWPNIERIDGVFSSLMAISSEPNLGDWEITATATNLVEKVTISVDKYVLPRFKVELKTPSYVYRNKSNISVEVNALYTSGKGVNGNATITFEVEGWQSWLKPLSKNVSIVNGKGVIEFDPRQYYYYQYNGQQYRIRTNVTETLSGFTRSASSVVNYYEKEYQISRINKLRNFRRGLPHVFQIQVLRQDGTTVSDTSQNSIRIEGCLTAESNSSVDKYYTMTPEGTLWLECLPATPDAYYTYIYASYKDYRETIYLYDDYESYSKSDSGIRMQIYLSQPNASTGDNVTISAKTNLPAIQALNYFLIGRHSFVGQGRIVVADKPTSSASVTFSVPEFEGSSLRIFVFFREGGEQELIQDNIFLYKKQDFMTIKANATECQPGDSVTLNFRTHQPTSSLLAIRAVDQSVLLVNKRDWDVTESTTSQKRVQINNYRYNYGNIRDEFINANLAVLIDRVSKLRFLEVMEYAQYSQTAAASRNLVIGGAELVVSGNEADAHIRSKFPETWIWEERRTNGTNTTLVATLPDTLTSWMITGFSLSSKNGLETMQSSQIVTVRKDFFLSLNLPYAVIRKKAFALEVYVFNYLDKDVETNVTLDNTDSHYQFVDSVERLQVKVTKTITIPANQANAVAFVITPMRADSMNLNVTAKTNSHSDIVYQTVNVIPEGIKKVETKHLLVEVSGNKSFNYNFTLDFPTSTVKGADQITISVTADVLGNALENLEGLIRYPCGCGEQTLLSFVPDIAILKYLESTGRLTESILRTIISYLEGGYANMLRNRRSDGSFSVFGSGDQYAGTWLTAQVVKYFVKASKHITIDEQVIERAVDFLLTMKNSTTGEFIEKGVLIHRDMGGGTFTAGVPITAHVVLALLEYSKSISNLNPAKYETLTESLNISLSYISKQSILDSNDVYAIAICAYTLQLANHSSKDAFFTKLNSLAVSSNTEYGDGLIYWKTTEDYPTYASPLRIEVASYAILTFIHRGEIAESRPIVKYILQKRNSLGGFISSQDTLMGITAMTAYASKTFVKSMNMNVTADFSGTSKKFLLGQDSDVLQQVILKNTYRWCRISALGSGVASVQITWSYYAFEETPPVEANKPFAVSTKVTNLGTGNAVELSVCSKATFTNKTAMAMVEILLPPNYGFDEEDAQSVRDATNVKRVEILLGGAKLNVYYNYLLNEDLCFTMISTQNYATADVRLATIKVYEYNGAAETTVYVKLPRKTVCDICDEYVCDADQCAARKRK